MVSASQLRHSLRTKGTPESASWVRPTCLLLVLLMGGCGGQGGGTDSPTRGSKTKVKVTDTTQPATLTLSPRTNAQINLIFPANSLPHPTTLSAEFVSANDLPKSLTRVERPRGFTPNSNNLYIAAFDLKTTATPVSAFNLPVSITASGLVPSSISANTTLDLAYYQGHGSNARWIDVETFQVGTNGAIAANLPSTQLPGVLQPGTYVLYKPGQGTSVANLGIAMVGGQQGGVWYVHLFDGSGNPIPNPSPQVLNPSTAQGVSGLALTPDAAYGVLADEADTLSFFTGANTGNINFTTSISGVSSQLESVAMTPAGDTSVSIGNGDDQMITVSGITSGTPVKTDAIPVPELRNALVMSSDGKTLLLRGLDQVSVFAVTPKSPTPGTFGGTSRYDFTRTADLTTLGAQTQGGRGAMAISPTDSSRALVAGVDSSGTPSVIELTGLPNAPQAHVLHLQVPAGAAKPAQPSPRRGVKPRVQLPGTFAAFSVAISQNGKFAVVGTQVGLVLVSGVDTGNLAQVGPVFSPTYSAQEIGDFDPHDRNLGPIPTLGITLDNKYVVLVTLYQDFQYGSLLMYPVSASGFGGLSSQVDNVLTPADDHLIVH